MLPSSETDLWRQHVASLRAAVEMRKPDALIRVRLAVSKIEAELSACALRREIRARAGADSAALDMLIQSLASRMEDLREITAHMRATPLDHDNGPSPETAVRSREIVNGDGEYTGDYVNSDPGTDDLADDLKRAASDIRSGWLVITKRATCAVSGKQPGGDLDGGKPAILAEQYYHWVNELHRKRMATWSIDDVVCEGLSRVECAIKRRCSAEKVFGELVTGLTLYAETYPPLGGE